MYATAYARSADVLQAVHGPRVLYFLSTSPGPLGMLLHAPLSWDRPKRMLLYAPLPAKGRTTMRYGSITKVLAQRMVNHHRMLECAPDSLGLVSMQGQQILTSWAGAAVLPLHGAWRTTRRPVSLRDHLCLLRGIPSPHAHQQLLDADLPLLSRRILLGSKWDQALHLRHDGVQTASLLQSNHPIEVRICLEHTRLCVQVLIWDISP